MTTPEGSWELPPDELPFPSDVVVPLSWDDVLFLLRSRRRRGTAGEAALGVPDAALNDLLDLTTPLGRYETPRPHAFAPVRSRPQRTYDPITDIPDPEGQHVPMVLARLLADRKGQGAEPGETLTEFGEASGLFSEIDIHRLGREGDPFQILVKLSGPRRNLIDAWS